MRDLSDMEVPWEAFVSEPAVGRLSSGWSGSEGFSPSWEVWLGRHHDAAVEKLRAALST